MNEELATAIIAEFDNRKIKTVIDFEHQTMLASQNGQPAPAAGWFSKLEWRDNGLYAIDVEWTERASQMIAGGEYKYISPVFAYDKKTGAIKNLFNAALTNNPALDGMDAVAASQLLITQQTDQEALKMEGLMEQLRWLLNLPVTATADDIAAELQKAIDQIKSAAAAATSVPGFDVVALIKSQADQIAVLTAAAANPDPSKFVAVATMQSLQNEVAELRKQINGNEIDQIVSAALSAGQILPAQETWARDLGAKNIDSLKDYLKTAQPIAALTQTQTGGNPPAGGNTLDVNDSQAVAAAALKYQQEQAALGVTITTVQAVDFVTAAK
jgi:phage I-like protein